MKSLSAMYLCVPISIIASCAHDPASEVNRYDDAFRDVAAVTRDLIDDYSAALDALAAQDRESAPRESAYPMQFDPAAARNAEKNPPAIAGYENALLAMEEYNASLLDLSAGANDAVFAERAMAAANFLENIGALPAGLPVTDIAHEVLALLAQAKSAKAFKSTVSKGKPLIERLLQLFADSTADFFRVRVGLIGASITDIEYKQEAVLRAIDNIAGEFAPPSAGTELALRRAQLESEVALLRAEIAPSHAATPLPVGGAPYTSDVHARIEEQVEILRGLCAERRELAEGLDGYHAQLGEYVRLLDETEQYFDALVRATETKEIAVSAHAVSTRARKLHTGMRHTRSAQSIPNAPIQ